MSPALTDGDWVLRASEDSDFDELMTWFPDAESVNIWGGPGFRYPFDDSSFREDCRLDEMRSYSLWKADGTLAAFGQVYDREGRGHLARLVSNPSLRRQGAGKQLIYMIIEALEGTGVYDEYSLFVFRDNTPAYQCYLRMGFTVASYPADAPMPDKCYFLTRTTRRREQ